MIASDEKSKTFICGRCKTETSIREGYEFEGKQLCVQCYRNETRRGIDDIILQRNRIKIPKI